MTAVLWTVRVLDVAAATAVGVLLVLAWTTAQRLERRFLVPMLVGVEAWVLGDLIARSAVDPGVVRGAVILQLVASGGVVLCLLLFALAYTGRGDAIRVPLVALLLVEPVGFGLLALTDSAHRLVLRESLASHSVVEAAGPALLGHIAYSYLLVTVALLLAGELLYRAAFVYRRQATALVIGISAPFLGNVLYFFTPVPVDLTPVMFVVTGGTLTYATLRADFLEISPMARSAVLDTITNGFLVLDRHGTVLDSNPRGRRLLGLDGPIAVGRPLAELVPVQSDSFAQLLESIPPEREQEFEVEVANRILDVRMTPLTDHRERPVGAVVVLHDITKRERQRRALGRQRERLDRFAGVVSHDLRNPLNVAAARITLAREEADLEQLDPAIEALDRMEGILEGTLTLARQGKSIGDTDAVDLAELCEGCWRMIEAEEATLEVDSAAAVRGDRTRLGQLFENLFRNAVEHAGEDATVRVATLCDGFYVEDDGPGIPVERRYDVREPGYSVADGGTGLGLAIVEEIAEGHGWELEITAGRDGGARFEFTDVAFLERPAPDDPE